MQTLRRVSVCKQTQAAPPGPVSAEMTEPVSRGNMSSVEDASLPPPEDGFVEGCTHQGRSA